jgi:hypothetical protein
MDTLDTAYEVCCSLIGINRQIVTTENITAAIKQVVCMPLFNDVDQNALRLKLEALYNVKVDDFRILESRESRTPWLKNFKSQRTLDQWPFWNRYKQYLGKKFSPAAIEQTDKLTDTILDKLFDPNQENVGVTKKGLVVGQVQAGKTSNYTGLICKAADAGFDFIVVLAGIHNNLRSQTQTRLDEGFLGFDTQYERAWNRNTTSKIGVGFIRGFDDAKIGAISYTTSRENGDFTKSAANSVGVNFNIHEPFLFVIKKNKTPLSNLITWINANSNNGIVKNKSLLLIDDEADNASLNTRKPEEDPTTINGLIKELLNEFEKKAYVGYTATPFANIFVSQENNEDLFPKDFIINIPAPNNYIGPEKVFGTSSNPETDEDVLPIVKNIKDYQDYIPNGHKKNDPLPTDIPNSLKEAIKCFILTCAIRIARGQEFKHNSMLVHVTRYTNWQNCIKELVETQFNYYKQEIEANDDDIYEELRHLFEEDTKNYDSYVTTSHTIMESSLSDIDNQMKIHTWGEIKPLIYKAVQKIEVKSINGKSNDALTYFGNPNGVSVIAIGGDKLSRGLTLEGLSVSYFLRASKMYDTLMQMGRWFGYRPGYVDLCRLYMSSELNTWYRHITLANSELLEEFNYMAEINETPDHFALKVRQDPGELMITAAGKMRNANNIEVSWAGRLIETYQLELDKGFNHANYIATDNFLSSLGDYDKINYDYLWRSIPANEICKYFEKFRLPASLVKVDLELINEYIKKVNPQGELNCWNVALIGNSKSTSHELFSRRIKIGLTHRSCSDQTTDDVYYIRKNHILGKQTDEFIDLDTEMIKEALAKTKELFKGTKKPWDKSFPSPKIVREKFRPKDEPLLMIFPLDPLGANKKDEPAKYSDTDEPIIGFAISFPHSDSGLAVSYAVNMKSEYIESSVDFDEETKDDE